MNSKIISYLDNISSKLKINFIIMILALIIYLFWYLCGISEFILNFQNIKISLGHISYMGLLFLPAYLVIENDLLQKLWIFFSSLSLLDLINLIYITNGKLEQLPYNFFSSTFLFILIILFFIVIFFAISKSITTVDFKTKFKDLLIVIYSSVFFVFIYHLSNIWLVSKNIKNIDRSLFINNLEIHHINYGIFLLIFVPFLFKYISRLSNKLKFLGFTFIGFIYGTVFDESFYYMNEFKTEIQYDKLYLNNIFILLISLIIMIVSFFIWFYILKKQKEKNVHT